MANNLGGNVTKFTRNLDKIIEHESKTSFLFDHQSECHCSKTVEANPLLRKRRTF